MLRLSSSRILTAAVSAVLAVCTSLATAGDDGRKDHSARDGAPLELAVLGTYSTGLGPTSAEIVAFDASKSRLFVSNAVTSTIDIVDASNPAQLVKLASIDVSAFGVPNSVTVGAGVVAVAIEAVPKTNPGFVAFFKNDGALISSVQVGAQPDMLRFTPDGKFLLTANEGEPSGYGEGHVDPEGSVSIIPTGKDIRKLRNRDVRTVDFKSLIGKEDWLRSKGVRIYGPGANGAQDVEPEYVAVSSDSRKAFVTLQENNAIAEIDIAHARLNAVWPLGFKNHGEGPYVTSTFEWTGRLPPAGITKAGQKIDFGGFSGLAFEGTTRDGRLRFVTHTDRGPNAEPTGILRPFLLPEFIPQVVRFTLDPSNGRFELEERIFLKRNDGTSLTGLPNTKLSANASQPYNDEVPVDLFGHEIALDPLGADLEGIVLDVDGSMWMCDEYRPAIYHFDPRGRLLQRYIPIGTHAAAGKPVPAPGMAGEFGIEALPAVIAQRRQNRGFEGIALQGGKLYAFVQSPARNPATLGNAALNSMRNVRLVELDPSTLATRMFLYALDNPALLGADDTPADKIGDLVATPGSGFLALERDDDAVPADPIETITKRVYAFKLGTATDVSALSGVYPVERAGAIVNVSIDQMTTAELAPLGAVPITKTLHVDLAQAGFAGVQKIEGLALLDSGRLAVVNDNDFGVAQISIDPATGLFTRAPGYAPEPNTVGLISVTGLDASDRDNGINIRNWPTYGMYLPDAIAAYQANGKTYLVTANEGDARDWPGFAEEARVSALTLDPAAFPDAAALRNNAALGRLNVTRTLGDVNGDAAFEALYTLGGRSFSIWRADTGQQVFDSDADLERITAAAHPANFNAGHENNTLDDRSDNKGPEPEGLAVGEIGRRTYAFVGLERIGGIAMYDITTPSSPFFVDYANRRNFAATPPAAAAEDLGPEGLTFIPSHQSPTGRALLAVAHEVSGTVTLFEVRPKE
jgi:DNA-binding beta-propeller fold protein YncE